MAKDFSYLPEWLPPRIEATGLSVEMFARKCNVSRASVYAWLTYRSRPDTQMMAKVCHVLGISLEEGLCQYTPRKYGRPTSRGSVRELSVRQQ